MSMSIYHDSAFHNSHSHYKSQQNHRVSQSVIQSNIEKPPFLQFPSDRPLPLNFNILSKTTTP